MGGVFVPKFREQKTGPLAVTYWRDKDKHHERSSAEVEEFSKKLDRKIEGYGIINTQRPDWIKQNFISGQTTLGMTKEEILTGIKNLKSLNRRLSIQRTPQGFTIIDDSYNISEDSFKAALGFLKEAFPDKRKIVITAGLVEQGDKKSEANILFGEKLKETADIILIPKNSNTPYLIKGLKLSKNEILEYNNNGKIIDNSGKKAVIFNDVDELHCNFRLIFKPNDAVLIFPYDLPAHYH